MRYNYDRLKEDIIMERRIYTYTNKEFATLKSLPAIPRNECKLYQGDVCFIVAKTEERTGWYQKLRCDNGKVNYVKIYPSSVNRIVYSTQTIEKYDWSRVNDDYPYISYIVSGGENVAELFYNNFNVLDKIRDKDLLHLMKQAQDLRIKIDIIEGNINKIMSSTLEDN